MQRDSKLEKEIMSLDMMINALAIELAEQLDSDSASDGSPNMVGEIVEALEDLRLERGVRKMLLSAFAGRPTLLEKSTSGGSGRGSGVTLLPAA